MARLLTLLWKAGALSEIETPRSWGTFFSPILSSFKLKKRTQNSDLLTARCQHIYFLENTCFIGVGNFTFYKTEICIIILITIR